MAFCGLFMFFFPWITPDVLRLRQNGISLPPEEPVVEDQWQKSYKLKKMIERGEMPLSRASVDVAWLSRAAYYYYYSYYYYYHYYYYHYYYHSHYHNHYNYNYNYNYYNYYYNNNNNNNYYYYCCM